MAPEFVCPTVPVKLGERVFNLRMNMEALTLAEKLNGLNYCDPDNWQALNVTQATAIFWECAVQTDKALTLGDIRAFPPRYLSDIVDGCRLAWRAATEVPAEEPRPTSELTPQREAVPA